MSWPQSTIEEACVLITDGTHYTPPDVGEGIPFLTVKDLAHDGKIDLVNCAHITEEEFERADNGNSAPKPGDILFSKDGTVGKVYVVDSDIRFAVLSSLAILRPEPSRLDSEYFGWVLRTDRCLDQASKSKTGSAIRRIILKDLKRVHFPLPPLSEQRRIAGILDAADALRAKRREALAHLDTLLQSTFLDMFGDPVANPMGWEIVRLSDVVQRLDGGKNVAQSETPTHYRVLKVSAVTYGVYLPDESKYLPADFAVPESYIVKSGDLLISRANTVELIGATAYVWETPENMVLPDKIWKFIWKKGAKIEPLYVYHLTRNIEFRRILGSRASGTSGSMKNIAKPKLLSLPIPLPPIDLQREFAAIVESVERQKARMRAHLAELDALFASLQSRAFKGAL